MKAIRDKRVGSNTRYSRFSYWRRCRSRPTLESLERRQLLSETISVGTPQSVSASNMPQMMVFPVTRTTDPENPNDKLPALTVTYKTINGTAVSGIDYTGTADGTAMFTQGSTTADIDVPILPIPANSTTNTLSKTFSVQLTGVQNFTGQPFIPLQAFNAQQQTPTAIDAVNFSGGSGQAQYDGVIMAGSSLVQTFTNSGQAPYLVAAHNNGSASTGIASGNFYATGPDFAAMEPLNPGTVLGEITLYQSSSNGSLTVKQTLTAPSSDFFENEYTAIAVGQFADGKYFVAAATEGVEVLPTEVVSTIQVFIQNSPGGTFGLDQTISLSNPASALAVGDLNGNGVPDIVANSVPGSGTSNSVDIYQGTGGDSFATAPISITSTPALSNPESLAIGDLSGNGQQDLVIGDSNGVNILMNTTTPGGTLTFQPGTSPQFTTGITTQVAVADLNNSGKPAILSLSSGSNTISVFQNNGDGTFQQPVSITVPSGTYGITTGDFNGDGLPDLAYDTQSSVSGVNGTFTVLLNDTPAVDGTPATGTILGTTVSLSTSSGPIPEIGGAAVITAALSAALVDRYHGDAGVHRHCGAGDQFLDQRSQLQLRDPELRDSGGNSKRSAHRHQHR